jgi:streptogramin lyase
MNHWTRQTAFLATFATVAVLLGSLVAVALLPSRLNSNAAQPASQRAVVIPPKLAAIGGTVTQFAIDATGTLWFASIRPDGNNSVYRYAPRTDELAKYSLPSEPGGGFFVGIAAAPNGNVWIGWDHTLTAVDAAGAARGFAVPADTSFPVGKTGNWIRDLALSADGHVWLSRASAGSLLEFDPKALTFSEHSLGVFGVPDRLHVARDGRVWATQAVAPVSLQEHTMVAVLDPSTSRVTTIPEAASDVAFTTTGVLVVGNVGGISHLDPSGTVLVRDAPPFPASASDVVVALPDGRVVISNRVSSSVAVSNGTAWDVIKLPTKITPVFGPAGYQGPKTRETTAEVTDIEVAPDGDVWVAIPTYGSIAHFRP